MGIKVYDTKATLNPSQKDQHNFCLTGLILFMGLSFYVNADECMPKNLPIYAFVGSLQGACHCLSSLSRAPGDMTSCNDFFGKQWWLHDRNSDGQLKHDMQEQSASCHSDVEPL